MSYLKAIREAVGWTQSEAAQKIGMNRQYLIRLEQGRALPTAAQAMRMALCYGAPVSCDAMMVSGRRLCDRADSRPYRLEVVNVEPWRTAQKFWGGRLAKKKLDPLVWEWMCHHLCGESSHECYFWGQVQCAGAQPFLGNPLMWGFDEHVLVDRLGKLLGVRILPGLVCIQGDLELIFWPQVSLRTEKHTFRADALVFVRKGKRRFWMILEIDGPGHSATGDAYRSQQLQMLEVRLSGEEVRQGQAFGLLMERIEACIRQKAA